MSVITNPALVVREVTQTPERDQHSNWSYWIACDGVDKNIAVSHKGEKPVMQPGDTFEQHGFAGYEVKRSQAGNTYYKAVRPASQNNGSHGSSRGGDGSYSPEVQARIDAVGRVKGRCHAQAVAAGVLGPQIAALINDPDALGPFLNGPYKRFVNWLVSDAETARQETTS